MPKGFKEYMSYVGGVRLGNPADNITPIASLGDVPPKDQGGKDSRGVGLTSGSRGLPLKANYSTQAPGTMRPMLTAAKKIQDKNKKDKVKEDKDIDDFLNDLANNTPNEEQFEDTKRIPKKPGQKDKSDKHSDLYTDEDPRGTIHGLGFTDAKTARKSVSKIKNSGRTHAHKIQAAIAMSQRAKVASQRAKDPEKKRNLGQAHKIYQEFIDKNKKSK